MTAEQIELVQRAWGKVTALSTTYVAEVYEELFRLSPELRTLFPSNPEMPVTKVADTLNTVITSLDQLDALSFIIRDLGKRHQKFNVDVRRNRRPDEGGTDSEHRIHSLIRPYPSTASRRLAVPPPRQFACSIFAICENSPILQMGHIRAP